MRTYEARVHLDAADTVSLEAYAARFSRALRTFHARRVAKRTVRKSALMTEFGLTARQFNAMRVTLDGLIASLDERRAGLVAELAQRIHALEAKIAKTTSAHAIHQLRRRLARLAARKARLEAGSAGLCFGSRQRFAAQHHLRDNGFVDHAAWLQGWRASRNGQFFVLGSKDETAGCQGCVLTHLDNDRFALRLRLPNAAPCKYLRFEVFFAYGAEHLVEALQSGQAISYRFRRDAKGWRVFASTKAIARPTRSDTRAGSIGVDLNVDHVALSESDRHGNLVHVQRLPLVTYGVRRNAAKTATDAIVKAIIALAVSRRKPIALERLNFAKKKAQLAYASPKRTRMLSAFAYRRFARILCARASDAGIAVRFVSPAYSSKIGAQKYARRYGLSVHLAAALVLARRGQGFRDRYERSSRLRHSHRTREDAAGHVQTYRAAPPGCGRAEGGPHERSSRGDPGGAAAHPVISPFVAGGNPAREASLMRVRAASIAT